MNEKVIPNKKQMATTISGTGFEPPNLRVVSSMEHDVEPII